MFDYKGRMNIFGLPRGRIGPALTLVVALGSPTLAAAQPTSTEPTKPFTYQPGQDLRSPTDPVVAIVDGRSLHLSQIGDLLRELPPDVRGARFDKLYPVLLDDLIGHTAVELKARRLHLDEDPTVKRRMEEAAGRALEQALIERREAEQVTEAAIHQLYQEMFGGKTAVDEVHLKLILLTSSQGAVRAMARLNAGDDFGTVAREMSQDASAWRGGDIGIRRQDQLQPEIGAVAFSLHPHQTAPAPVHNRIGWFIIRVEDRTTAPVPSFDEAHDDLRRILVRRTVDQTVAEARKEASVQEFNVNGTSITDQSDALLPYLPPLRDN